MKLIIQIPCYNEEKTLPITLKHLPQKIEGIDEIEILIINDGSTDKTIEVAKKNRVNHIANISKNKGLANAFRVGIQKCLELGADIIVNTDADNQYKGEDIEKLVKPILKGQSDIVVGERDIESINDFSFIKKKLQKLGSMVVRVISKTDIPDVTSGFRAYSREAALRMNVLTKYTYTLETIIQAGRSDMIIDSIPIRTNKKLRESRLFNSTWKYIYRSIDTIIRIFAFYEPLKFFAFLGNLFMLFGVSLGIRFLILVYLINSNNDRTYIPSIILGTSMIIIAILVYVIGFLADVINYNRKLNEKILYNIKKMKLKEFLKNDKK